MAWFSNVIVRRDDDSAFRLYVCDKHFSVSAVVLPYRLVDRWRDTSELPISSWAIRPI